jgi:hypothetical protein
MGSLATTLSTEVVGFLTQSSLPSAGANYNGYLVYCTTTTSTNYGLNYCDGSNWHHIPEFSIGTSQPSPAFANQFFYNTTTGAVQYYNGTSWVNIIAYQIPATATSGQVLTSTGSAVQWSVPTVTAANVGPVSVNSQSGSTYTTVLADGYAIVLLSNTTSTAVSIPTNASVAYPVGTQLNFIQAAGAGQVTISATTPATTTIVSNGATSASPKLRVIGSAATAIKTSNSPEIWYVMGDIV